MDEAPDLLKSMTSAYRSALAAFARAASRSAPQLSPVLGGNLDVLPGKLTIEAVAEIDRKVVSELEDWGERSSGYLRQKATEVREILLLVTQTAQAAGEKDERYVAQLSAFSGRLHDIASLEDLTCVRHSLSQSAADLKTCAGRMAEDGKAMLSKLQSEVAMCQSRLREVEKEATIDPLTGLVNRRGIERRMEDRIGQNRPFSLVLFDLNHFKRINDTHGHLAGDELLKQFGAELQNRFRSIDAAGRWGGDEFLVVFDGSAEQAQTAVTQASGWLFGDYRLKSGKVHLTAAAGIAQWNGRESASETLNRADAQMYRQKETRLTA